jgi:hypothetical protein
MSLPHEQVILRISNLKHGFLYMGICKANAFMKTTWLFLAYFIYLKNRLMRSPHACTGVCVCVYVCTCVWAYLHVFSLSNFWMPEPIFKNLVCMSCHWKPSHWHTSQMPPFSNTNTADSQNVHLYLIMHITIVPFYMSDHINKLYSREIRQLDLSGTSCSSWDIDIG